MTRAVEARRERFLPYAYARAGIELAVVSCRLDDETELEPEGGASSIELEGAWTRVSIHAQVRVSAAVLREVSAKASDLEVAIVLRCAPTMLRLGRRLRVSALDAPLPFELELARDDLAGSAQLRAFLVRVADGPLRGARLADSRSWELRVDRAREPRGEYLDVRYRKFSEDEAVPARDRGNLYRLDFDQESPVLWINADHDRIAAILDSRGTVGRAARMREAFFDPIAQGVWSQLFLKAASDLVTSEETVYPWQDGVLDLLLRDVFPEVRSATERRERLVESWSDLPELVARLDAGLQRRNDLAAHLAKLVDEEGA